MHISWNTCISADLCYIMLPELTHIIEHILAHPLTCIHILAYTHTLAGSRQRKYLPVKAFHLGIMSDLLHWYLCQFKVVQNSWECWFGIILILDFFFTGISNISQCTRNHKCTQICSSSSYKTLWLRIIHFSFLVLCIIILHWRILKQILEKVSLCALIFP